MFLGFRSFLNQNVFYRKNLHRFPVICKIWNFLWGKRSIWCHTWSFNGGFGWFSSENAISLLLCVTDFAVESLKINQWLLSLILRLPHWNRFNLHLFPLLLLPRSLCDQCWSSLPLAKGSRFELQSQQLSEEYSPLNLWELIAKSMNSYGPWIWKFLGFHHCWMLKLLWVCYEFVMVLI